MRKAHGRGPERPVLLSEPRFVIRVACSAERRVLEAGDMTHRLVGLVVALVAWVAGCGDGSPSNQDAGTDMNDAAIDGAPIDAAPDAFACPSFGPPSSCTATAAPTVAARNMRCDPIAQ